MSQSSREIVRRTLTFEYPERVPIDIHILQWARLKYQEEVNALTAQYPNDIVIAPNIYNPSLRAEGNPYQVGTSTDDWGCVFENIHAGIMGEVREPLIGTPGEWKSVIPPYELLPEKPDDAIAKANCFCASTDKFVRGAAIPGHGNVISLSAARKTR